MNLDSRNNPDPDPDPGFWWPKEEKNLQIKENVIFLKKCTDEKKFTIYLAQKDVQATGEAFSPQKKTFSTSKHEISEFF